MFAADFTSADWGGVIEGGATIAVSLTGVLIIGKFILIFQERMVNASIDISATAVARSTLLEGRVTDLEKRLESEQDEHFDCRREMNRLRIESAREIGALKAKVEILIAQLNRPMRSTDLEREMDVKLDVLLEHDDDRDVPGLRYEPTDDSNETP